MLLDIDISLLVRIALKHLREISWQQYISGLRAGMQDSYHDCF
jgi:hypothetical protein